MIIHTKKADAVDCQFFSSIWRKQEGGHHQHHGDQAGQDDASSRNYELLLGILYKWFSL